MLELDVLLTHLINAPAGQHAWVDQLLIRVASLGAPVMVTLVAVQWWRRADRIFVRHVLVAAGLSFLLGLGLNQMTLILVHRIRPYDAGISNLLLAPSADWSLPSDHAKATMAVAAAFLLHRMPRAGIFFLAVSLLMMFSRVYVGIHYAGDVLAGAATAIAAALLAWKLYRPGTRLDRLITGLL